MLEYSLQSNPLDNLLGLVGDEELCQLYIAKLDVNIIGQIEVGVAVENNAGVCGNLFRQTCTSHDFGDFEACCSNGARVGET